MYDKITGLAKLSGILNKALRDYNENNAARDLVLFEDAMKHVGKITRIAPNSRGHALLVGVGGSGRQSLSRLSAHIMICSAMMTVISVTYGLNDLKADLQSMYNKAGVKDEGVMFLFTDGQISSRSVQGVTFLFTVCSQTRNLWSSSTIYSPVGKLPTCTPMKIKTPFATRIAVGTEAPG